MARPKQTYKIPFIKVPTTWGPPVGSVPEMISNWEMREKGWEQKYDWRNNEPFEANIRFVEFTYAGKAVFVNTETDAKFFMSRGALELLLLKKSLIFGAVLGTWKFKKHGTTYSLWPVV